MIWTYNKIVKNKNHIKFAEKNIDVQLKKRFDALPNIASTASKFLTHEKELHSKVASLRSQYKESSSKEDKNKVEHELSNTLNDILISIENYPDLKSDKSILHLQRSINEFAEQISASQRAYNSAVLEYDNSISTFPSNIVAKIFGFKTINYMEIISSTEKQNININQYL